MAHPDHVRCSDADRSAVEQLLADSYVDGRLTRSEHDERVQLVWQAKTFAELRAVTHDLATSPHQRSTAVGRSAPATKLTCIFSENRHGINGRLSQNTSITAVFGEFDLDLRDVDFAPGEYRIHVRAAMSEITLRLPPGVRVRNRLTTILSEYDAEGLREDGSVDLVLSGTCVMTEVEVYSGRRRKTELIR